MLATTLGDTISECTSRALAVAALPQRDVAIAGTAAALVADTTVGPLLAEAFVDVIAVGAPELRIAGAVLDDRVAAELDLASVTHAGLVHETGQVVVHVHADCVSRLDRSTGTIEALLAVDGTLPAWQRAKPLQLPLSVALADRGVYLVHAGAVARGERALLIGGPSGAGKSTAALAGAGEGLDFLGDDCVGLERAGRRLVVHRVYRTASIAAPGEGAKSVVAGGTGHESGSAAVAAVVLPRITGRDDVVLRRCAPAEALRALAPSTILRRAVPAAAVLRALRDLVAAVPVLVLEMGPRHAVGPALTGLLETGLP